ncbi:LCP family protein [Peterkaempfera sp. SMS 1(5)a]|uniref:LCP family protein n=1 Tax=Peterkaempfera podocarpi TaxID=3232308 RepID=UPI00366DBB17
MSTSSDTPEPPEQPVPASSGTAEDPQSEPGAARTGAPGSDSDASDTTESTAPADGTTDADTPAEGTTDSATPAEGTADADADSTAPADDSAEAATPDDGSPDDDAPDAPDTGTPADAIAAATAVRRRRRRRLLAAGAGTLALLLTAGGGSVWWAYHRLDGNIRTDTATNQILQHEESARPTHNTAPATYNAENILLIGSDDRSGANSKYGDSGGQRSDTTILLHLSADRKRAVAVSIPRDAMVQVPSCERPDGSHTSPQHVQFNWAFEFGGAACTIRTVEDLTGIRIDHHLIVDFSGFKKMVDAVGGVDVCLAQDVHDRDAKLDLPAGPHKLNGEQALGFVRVRETLGDGSDTQRMGRQQEFLASLVKKVQSDGVLLNPTKLWPLLDSATSAITADPGLSSLSALYDLAESLRSMPTENVAFLTAPREPYPADHNRDQLVQPAAGMLFQALAQDRPVQVTSGPAPTATTEGGESTATPSPSGSATATGSATASASASATASAPGDSAGVAAALTFSGRTADQNICGKG